MPATTCYFRSTVDGSIISGLKDDPALRAQLLVRRDDRPNAYVYEFAPDCAPSALSAVELEQRGTVVPV
jgi:hypothetical protein